MSKIVSIKETSAIFLAIVLVAGTIAAISPSFIIKGVDAQAGPEYYEYDSYGLDYPDKKYDSYGYSDYGMDSSYDKKSYYKKSYGNDNGYDKSKYQSSYKSDYKPKYPSYGKENYKSNKDSSSDIINKIKCTTNNIVINGNNTGNVNIGNNGQVPTADAEGYLGAGDGYSGDERYNDGYNNKQGKGFTCIIENNNIINNILAGAGGNVTDGGGNVTKPTCEECFARLSPTAQAAINDNLAAISSLIPIPGTNPQVIIPADVDTIAELCMFLAAQPNNVSQANLGLLITFVLTLSLDLVNSAEAQALVNCLIEAGVITVIDT